MNSDYTDISKVDTHQHFWQLSRGDYRWLTPDYGTLYQDFLPDNLTQQLSKNGISQTVLVQAAQTEEETQFLLELANKWSFVGGVVGWIDLESPTALTRLEHFTKNTYFKGIRPWLKDIDDAGWILKDKFTPIFECMSENHLTFDALITDIHLSNIQILAERHPNLSIVINHCAKPDLSQKISVFWKSSLVNIGACANVCIKLSGLMTEAPKGKVSTEVLKPCFDHIMEVFGPDRILWGSDWPVLTLNGDYESWVSLTNSLLREVSFEDASKILAGNARTFYNLPLG
ncbi:MAG: amidohydrolase [Phycisphaerae bacterium]|nr:amidohydrolase [Phycisphaerae bacterium]|tara:strand:+ start:1406 stop:2266 length:861 start_codon:yes stop_codon:yes gene_type:complete